MLYGKRKEWFSVQGHMLHWVIRSLLSPLIWNSPQSFFSFMLWHFWRVQTIHCVELKDVPRALSVSSYAQTFSAFSSEENLPRYSFLSWLWDFWRVCHTRERMTSVSPITSSIDFYHLVQVVSVRSPHCKITIALF